VDVKGKILVVLINDPDFDGTLPDNAGGDFGGKAMTYYGRWTYKYEEAARRGAAGVMIVHETAPASYGWATVKNSNTNSMFDIVRDDPAKAHPGFESWIQRDLAVRLFKDSGLDFEAAKAAARRKNFRPIPLKATLTASATAKSERINTYNIAARLAGKSRPDETVIYSAHYDHLGIGQPDANGDRIFNGAVDNATGISFMIEMARAFAKAPPTDRSVLFLAVGAEEKGLLGSEYYASHPLYPLAKTVAVLNTDSMGIAGAARDFSMAGLTKLELVDLLVAEGRRQGRTFVPDAHPESGGFYRSDHFSFAKRGVPAVSFKSGRDLVNGGIAAGEKWGLDYSTNRYHQPDDEWLPNWSYDGMIADGQLLYGVGRALANSRQWPNWSADAEFRAARDATASERR
jgi:Zn-dependent M28 family amino/carboxypeptidase